MTPGADGAEALEAMARRLMSLHGGDLSGMAEARDHLAYLLTGEGRGPARDAALAEVGRLLAGLGRDRGAGIGGP